MAGDTPKKVEEPDAPQKETRDIVERDHRENPPFFVIKKRAILEVKRDGYYDDVYNLKYYPDENRYTMKLVKIGKPKRDSSDTTYLIYVVIASVIFVILWFWLFSPRSSY